MTRLPGSAAVIWDQASRTVKMSAHSARWHPAPRSGSTTVWWGARSTSAASAMK